MLQYIFLNYHFYLVSELDFSINPMGFCFGKAIGHFGYFGILFLEQIIGKVLDYRIFEYIGQL